MLTVIDNNEVIKEGKDMRYFMVLASALMSVFISFNACFAAVDVTLSAEIKANKRIRDMAVTPGGRYVFVLTDDAKVSIYTNKSVLKGVFSVDPGVVAISASGRGDMLYLLNGKDNAVDIVQIDFIEEINTAGSPFKGPENAPVTIVEFSDFQCPYCSKVPSLLEKILKKNPDTVKLVFKNYPLSFHKYAKGAAVAAMCAAAQGKFWEFHDYLFKHQAKLSKMDFNRVAEKLGLDMKKFKEVRAAAEKQVEKDMRDGELIGVSGTPSLYINGKKVKRRREKVIQKMIDEALAKSKRNRK